MAINYTHVDGDGLFDILGKFFQVLKTTNTARGTTIAQDALDAVNQYKLKTDTTLDFDRAMEGFASREKSARQGLSTLTTAVKRAAESLVIHFVQADSTRIQSTITPSLEYLIEQMVADAYYVDNSTVSVSVAAGGSNSSTDYVVSATDIGEKGSELDNAYAESIVGTVIAGGSSPSVQFVGNLAARSNLAEDWPDGSGTKRSETPVTVSQSRLSNGNFELDTNDDSPDSFIVEVGVPGSTIKLTVNTVQTVIISGTPTDGTYTLKYTDPVTSVVYSTATLAYNASGSSVGSALSALPGLGSVSVSTSGTTPDFTHTVTFTGKAGQVAALTSTENFDTGSIAHAITTAGVAGAITGKGLVFVADAAELTALYQQITIEADTVYVVGYWAKPSASVDAGVIEVALVDGIGGTVIQDAEGNNQIDSYDMTGVSAKVHRTAFFQVKENTSMPAYLRIRKSTAEATADIVVDDLVMSAASQLYSGGPYIAMFAGQVDPEIDDVWTITVANNFGGEFQKYFNAVFDMAGKGLLLPTSGSTLIPDTLIS